MPPTVKLAEGLLYTWTVTLADGTVRTNLGESADSVCSGNFPSPIVSISRGPVFTTDGPPPTISSLTPNTAQLGTANFTLHVIGTGFKPGAVIVFNGIDEPTTLVSATEVTTGVNMAVWLAPAALPVKVRSLLGQESNVQTFTFTP